MLTLREEERKYKDTLDITSYVCDCGSVLITDPKNKFGVLMYNGLGDCKAEVYQYNGSKGNVDPNEWTYNTMVYGDFNIHTYDCLDEDGNMYNIDHTILIHAKRTQFYYDKDCSGDILFEVIE